MSADIMGRRYLAYPALPALFIILRHASSLGTIDRANVFGLQAGAFLLRCGTLSPRGVDRPVTFREE